MSAPTSPRESSLEQRTSELQLQIEHVTVALQQIRQTHGTLQEMEARLAEITRDYASILERWARNDERHATAVAELHGRLSDWNDLERKLLTESTARIHQFERSIQHEWHALRQKHEEPLQKLDAQASRVTETCLSAVDAALRGFDRAEARLTTLEQEMYRQMGELSREVRDALSELRQPGLQLGAARPWPLEDVVRLHGEMRAEAADDGRALERANAIAAAAADTSKPAPAAVPPVRSLMTERASDAEPAPAARAQRRAWLPLAAVAVVVVGLLFYLGQRLDAGLRAATSRAVAAERQAAEARQLARDQISAVQRTTEQRLATARDEMRSAQLTANVLAAPDLYRLEMASAEVGPRASAQVLWSRSRGIVFSGSRLAPPPGDSAYQLWLVTHRGPVSVGLLQPDSTGRATAAFETPAELPRPVVGASLTVEPATGSPRPTGPVRLATPQPAAAPAPAQTPSTPSSTS